MKLYEGMFIVDANKAKESYESLEESIHKIITRYGGEIVKSVKWDERRMSFEIEKIKRGTYILVHFNSEGEAISQIERQVQMSEDILRVMITRDVDGIETNTGSAAGRAEDALGDEAPVTADASDED